MNAYVSVYMSIYVYMCSAYIVYAYMDTHIRTCSMYIETYVCILYTYIEREKETSACFFLHELPEFTMASASSPNL